MSRCSTSMPAAEHMRVMRGISYFVTNDRRAFSSSFPSIFCCSARAELSVCLSFYAYAPTYWLIDFNRASIKTHTHTRLTRWECLSNLAVLWKYEFIQYLLHWVSKWVVWCVQSVCWAHLFSLLTADIIITIIVGCIVAVGHDNTATFELRVQCSSTHLIFGSDKHQFIYKTHLPPIKKNAIRDAKWRKIREKYMYMRDVRSVHFNWRNQLDISNGTTMGSI